MGFIDFLKKIKKLDIVKKPERESEKIAFDKIEDWVENKRKEIEGREKEIFVLIKEKINFSINELKEKVNILESVDVDSIMAEDKVKFTVRENLNNYIKHVKSLIESLYNLKEENFEEFIARMNKIFFDFDKGSYKSHKKATFLIGKEIASVKESIINLFRYLMELYNENKDIVDSSRIVSFIKSKLKQIIETECILKKIDESITSLDRKITEKELENEKIEKIKKEKSYIENLKKQEEIKLLEDELEKDILSLGQLIDFKALANFFHIFKEEMSIVKTYKEDFQANFQKNDGKSILSLLEEAKLNNETISTKIKQINDKKKGITRKSEVIKKDETEDMLINAREIKLEIGNLDNEREKEKKRSEKLKVGREEIIDSIKQELAKINVDMFEV